MLISLPFPMHTYCTPNPMPTYDNILKVNIFMDKYADLKRPNAAENEEI